jgi:hypothetical protein
MEEDKSHLLHHLESMSLYDTTNPVDDRPVVSPPSERMATPAYQTTTIEQCGQMNRLVYAGLVLPDRYDGTGDPEVWLDDYESIADCNLWTESDRFMRLISVLEGAPRDWFKNERRRNPAFNWTLFKIGLKNRYTNQCRKLMAYNEILNRNQEKGETFNCYWESKLGLIERAMPTMSQNEKITHMITGLKHELYTKMVQKYVKKPPESLIDLYLKCKNAEDSINFVQNGEENPRRMRPDTPVPSNAASPKPRRRHQSNSSDSEDHMAQLVECMQSLVQRIEDKDDETKRQEKRDFLIKDLSNARCYRCGEFRHYSRFCPTMD